MCLFSSLFQEFYDGKVFGEFTVYLRLAIRAADMSEQYDNVNVSKYKGSIKYNISVDSMVNTIFTPFSNFRMKGKNESNSFLEKIFIEQRFNSPVDEYETIHADVYHLSKLVSEQLSSFLLFEHLKDIKPVQYFRQIFLCYALDSVQRSTDKNYLTNDHVTSAGNFTFRLETSINFIVLLPLVVYPFILESFKTKVKNKQKKQNHILFFDIAFVVWFLTQCLSGHPRKDYDFPGIAKHLWTHCIRLKKEIISEQAEEKQQQIIQGLHGPTIASLQHLAYDLWKTNASHFSSTINEEYLIKILNQTKDHSNPFVLSIMEDAMKYVIDRYRMMAFLEGMKVNDNNCFEYYYGHNQCPSIYQQLANINYDKISIFIHDLNDSYQTKYQYVGAQKCKITDSSINLLHLKPNEIVLSFTKYRKLSITSNFRKINIVPNSFILSNLFINEPSIDVLAKSVFKVYEIIDLETNLSNFKGLIVYGNIKATEDSSKFTKLYVDYNTNHFISDINVSNLVRTVHCCIFEAKFYSLLYGSTELFQSKATKRCVVNSDTRTIIHHQQNNTYWIVPFMGACQPMLYNWLSAYNQKLFKNS